MGWSETCDKLFTVFKKCRHYENITTIKNICNIIMAITAIEEAKGKILFLIKMKCNILVNDMKILKLNYSVFANFKGNEFYV